ncbi:MAG: hypothetical protein WBG34_03680 [Flavobacteriales bacterium]
MKTLALLRHGILFCTLFAMGTLFPLNSLAQGNSERVTIRGQVLVDDAMGNSNLEVVEVDNLVCVPLSMHPNGRFELVLTAGNKAYLRFEKEGYLTKEILVDTHNANITREAVKKNKMLRFAVQMTRELPDKRLQYAEPVGIISFLKGSGLMKVQYNHRLVRMNNGDIVAIEPSSR